jgi:flagellar hook protein FlgE
MSIFGTIYNGTTGLLTYSKGLDVISNNVANLNTAGFKRNDLLFRDLYYQYQLSGQANQGASVYKDGNGVTDGGTTTSYAQGDIQQSGNDTDIAIDGNGFFILRSEDEIFYSRVGQFSFDEEYYLVSLANDARVAGIDSSGNLTDISISALRTSPASATTEVSFVNNLSLGSTEHVIDDIEVFDALGDEHQLTLRLTNNGSETARSWLAEVEDENGDVVSSDHEIRFQGDGSPEDGFNQFDFTFEPDEAAPMSISFLFGEPGSFTGATSFSSGSSSDLAVEDQNGYGFGSQTNITFNEDGILEIEYSNGQSVEGSRLALAWINNLQTLRQIGNGLFTIDDAERMQLYAANENGMGEIVAGSIEISNVELSQEFTDLVIIQRGYQVSSQVVSIANEMLQQIIESMGSR